MFAGKTKRCQTLLIVLPNWPSGFWGGRLSTLARKNKCSSIIRSVIHVICCPYSKVIRDHVEIAYLVVHCTHILGISEIIAEPFSLSRAIQKFKLRTNIVINGYITILSIGNGIKAIRGCNAGVASWTRIRACQIIESRSVPANVAITIRSIAVKALRRGSMVEVVVVSLQWKSSLCWLQSQLSKTSSYWLHWK